MTLHPFQYRVGLMALTAFALLLAGTLTAIAKTHQPVKAVPEFRHGKRVVNDMQITVRHRDGVMKPYIYHHFTPTVMRLEDDTLVVEGSVVKSPDNETADVTVRLKTIISAHQVPRGETGVHWWYDDRDRINSMP